MDALDAIKEVLKAKLGINLDPVIIENPWGDGDTEHGFITTYDVDMEKLNAEIDAFSASFSRHSLSAQYEVLTDKPQANPHATTFPAEIWLQVGGDCDADECRPFQDIRGSGEITWCEDCIDGMDVHYIRADLAAAAPSPAVAAEPVAYLHENPGKTRRFLSHGKGPFLDPHDFDRNIQNWTATPLYTTPSSSLAVRDAVDAARYRFLRDNGVPTTDAEIEKALTVYQGVGLSSLLPDELDAAIDTAMKG